MNIEPRAETKDALIKAARQRWGTPIIAVRSLERILGVRVTLDVCAESWSAKAPLWFGPGSAHPDAFAVDSWTEASAGGMPFCNPPFADIAPWVDRLISEWVGRDLSALLWVPPRTDQPWWHRLARLHAAEPGLCRPIYIRGRVEHEPTPELARYYAERGKKAGGAGGGIVVWVMGLRGRYVPATLTREGLGWTAETKWAEPTPRLAA